MDDRRDNDEAAGAPQLKLAKTEDVDVKSDPLAWAPRSVRNFPTMVPMEYKFLGNGYYVHKCYPEYYQLVMEMLGEESGVTVTGTPGIGKSVFMAYFFERYSKDHPNATVIMLSYNKKSELRRVVVSRGGVMKEEDHTSRTHMEETVRTYINEALSDGTDDAIMLIDGPPKTIPEQLQWVSVTSPNEEWLDQIRKTSQAYFLVYMPTWTREELSDAVIQLKREDLEQETSDDLLNLLEIDVETEPTPRRPLIDVYFDVFGGVPRSCFVKLKRLLNEFESLRRAINGLTLKQVWNALEEENTTDDSAKRVHRLLHFDPVEDAPAVLGDVLPYQRARLRVGSLLIKRLIFDREEEITKGHQLSLLKMLRAAPQAHSFLEFLYEAKVYQHLDIGCTIEAVRVGAQSQDNSALEVSISKTCSVGGITNNFTTTAFDRTRSHLGIPFSKNLESIDGFYWHPNGETFRVVLFQVTVAKRHPVKAGGLIKVFKELNLWEAVQEDPQRAALVFVVPEDNVKHFIDTPQMVPAGIRADDTSPVETLSDVGKVRGGLLASCEIITVGQLRQCKTFADITKKPAEKDISKTKSAFSIAKKSLEKFESERCNGSEEETLLQSIPQYVWGL